MWKKVSDSIFLGYKINGDGDCSHEMKRCLFLERIAMMNLDSLLKSRDYHCITLPYSQSYGFSSSHVWMWELDHEEGWAPKKWCFRLWCWRRLLRVSLTARRSSQSILKEINPEYSLEGLMLELQLHALVTWCKELTQWKRPQFWECLRAGGKMSDKGWDG